jgi:ABC-type dipeptide/oligopeptide/nickel transport system permease subunit
MSEAKSSELIEEQHKARSLWQDAAREFGRNRVGLFGFLCLVLILILAAAAPWFTAHDPNQPNLQSRFEPGIWAGNTHNLLGTDELGRDILTRMIYGGRVSMTIGFIAVVITTVLGTLLGALSGYYGALLDMLIGRFIDLMLVLPHLLLALVIIAILGPGLDKAMIAVGIVYVPRMARLVRGSVLAIKSATYVEAARVIGASDGQVIRRHVLPNVMGPAIVFVSLLMGDAILYAAALGFLGLGAQPPTAEWGAMLSHGRDHMVTGNWWLSTFPGLAIAFTVVCLNLVGDALRDALDPQVRY